MRHYNTTFFCDKGNPPKPSVEIHPQYEDGSGWNVTFKLGKTLLDAEVTVFIKDEEDLDAFVADILKARQNPRGYPLDK